ncbi:MAG: septum formation initiator family protein [Clostridia bacterium]|nr:septum formation initiator family protein [Clostridia bacterium]
MKEKNREKRPISIILVLFILAFAGIITISQIKLHKDIKRLTAVSENYSKQISAYEEDNSNLQNILQNENASDYMEQYAREKLDYIKPNERVYADSDS